MFSADEYWHCHSAKSMRRSPEERGCGWPRYDRQQPVSSEGAKKTHGHCRCTSGDADDSVAFCRDALWKATARCGNGVKPKPFSHSSLVFFFTSEYMVAIGFHYTGIGWNSSPEWLLLLLLFRKCRQSGE